MGYILPVERYQYHDYQIRDMKKSTNVDSVEGPFKAVLEKKHADISNEYNRLNPSNYKTIPLKPQVTAVDSTIYSALTGKGKEINEII